MKKLEEYLERIYITEDGEPESVHDSVENVLDVCRQIQLDAIEATCKRCAENVKFCTESFVDKDGLWDTRETNEIDKNSIYEVADKMKEELE